MAKRRVRLNDENDPLSSTDKVLAGFEQVSKSTSQQESNLTIQEADKPTSQEDDLSKSQQDKADDNNLKEKLTSQQAVHIASPQDNNSTSQQANKSTSQQSKSEKTICRKSTFQINSQVLDRLDKLHLTLQLELGKTNAPYKEVIVEEALVRLLEEINSDPGALIEALVERQKSRDKI